MREKVLEAHSPFPHPLHCRPPPSITHPIRTQEAGNALVSPMAFRLSYSIYSMIDKDDRLLSVGKRPNHIRSLNKYDVQKTIRCVSPAAVPAEWMRPRTRALQGRPRPRGRGSARRPRACIANPSPRRGLPLTYVSN
ncbi:hypothetical protein EVAR_64108_1 [Eumeta japonica]|uniref:Uncharacterized protein n=1 Tax=Eumeta variegata TaxID=151549 RepID=A0A4C1ZJA2_EUMVA|nr:hypothetical protein EVAR_64108_1 [Eumeta japonica]